MDRLKKRAEFVDVAKGARLHKGAFSLQAGRRRPAGGAARFGFTVTKKTGNAVERNRIRRRLKAAVRDIVVEAPAEIRTDTVPGNDSPLIESPLIEPPLIQPGVDYVLIGRRDALTISFTSLRDELRLALRAIDPDRRSSARRAQPHTRD